MYRMDTEVLKTYKAFWREMRPGILLLRTKGPQIKYYSCTFMIIITYLRSYYLSHTVNIFLYINQLLAFYRRR